MMSGCGMSFSEQSKIREDYMEACKEAEYIITNIQMSEVTTNLEVSCKFSTTTFFKSN